MNLGESTVNSIVNAGYLHDIGKITVSDSILFKKELTEEEYNLIKKHSEIGSSIISNLDFSKEEAHIIRHHHEWYDGSGYPDGIKGERIPVGSRILAVADAYDTLSSGRIYQKPLTKNEILKILFQNNNDQFDPEVLKTLAKII
jgi:HD-GYP domain-containing protein (c-di-GMP phosphodiesterase class II)